MRPDVDTEAADASESTTGEPVGVLSTSDPDAWWQLQGSEPPGNKSSSSISSIAPSGFRTLVTSSKSESHLSSGIPRAILRISTRSKWSSGKGRRSRLRHWSAQSGSGARQEATHKFATTQFIRDCSRGASRFRSGCIGTKSRPMSH